jgi:hypothetical protein
MVLQREHRELKAARIAQPKSHGGRRKVPGLFQVRARLSRVRPDHTSDRRSEIARAVAFRYCEGNSKTGSIVNVLAPNRLPDSSPVGLRLRDFATESSYSSCN